MRRFTVAVLLAVVLVATQATPVLAHDRLDDLTNRFRLRHGEDRLGTPDHLHDVARMRARQLYRIGFFHDFSWSVRAGGCGWGENIMYRIPAVDADRARYAFDAFRGSDPHRRTMLGNWDRLGTHIFIAPNGGMYAVQLFVRNC